jgi:ferredoxin-NADP reductase
MKLTLQEVKPETGDIKTFIFKPHHAVHPLPGQYLYYSLPHPNPDDRETNRYFTNSSAPFEGHVSITTRISDQGSTFKKALVQLKPGDTIEAEEPDGDFILDSPEKPSVFIAGGIGITPFRSIILDLDHKNAPINVTLLYGYRNDDVLFKQLFDEIASRHPEFKVHYVIEPERITPDLIKEKIGDIKTPTFYVSGPEPMVEAFEKQLTEMGVPDNHQKQDFFPGYTSQ